MSIELNDEYQFPTHPTSNHQQSSPSNTVDPIDESAILTLESFLRECKCEQYLNNLVNEEVSLEDLVNYSEQDMVQQFNFKKGPARRLIQHVQQHKARLMMK